MTALSEPGKYQSPWPNMSSCARRHGRPGADACRYLLLNDGRIGLVTLRFVQKATEVENFAQNTDAVEALRAIVARAKARFPAVQIGLTGLPVMENDEMRLSQSAMTTVTFLSLGGVFLVLVAGFGGLRHSVLATVALVLGTIWTVGYTTVTVGYLNILSIAFGSILMGLGINYGIYYVARYLQMCVTSRSTAEALVKTAASVGPSITMGSCHGGLFLLRHRVDRFPRHRPVGNHRRRRHPPLLAGGHDRAAGHDHALRRADLRPQGAGPLGHLLRPAPPLPQAPPDAGGDPGADRRAGRRHGQTVVRRQPAEPATGRVGERPTGAQAADARPTRAPGSPCRWPKTPPRPCGGRPPSAGSPPWNASRNSLPCSRWTRTRIAWPTKSRSAR